jgi:hypothetical protein
MAAPNTLPLPMPVSMPPMRMLQKARDVIDLLDMPTPLPETKKFPAIV